MSSKDLFNTELYNLGLLRLSVVIGHAAASNRDFDPCPFEIPLVDDKKLFPLDFSHTFSTPKELLPSTTCLQRTRVSHYVLLDIGIKVFYHREDCIRRFCRVSWTQI